MIKKYIGVFWTFGPRQGSVAANTSTLSNHRIQQPIVAKKLKHLDFQEWDQQKQQWKVVRDLPCQGNIK